MSTDRSTLRAALLGYGYSGKTLHAPLIRSVEGLSLTHVSSRFPENVRTDLPDVCVADAATCIADPSVDLVVIATPNDTHFDLARSALRAGKHVAVDKPFALSVQHALELIERAEREKRVLTVFQNRRWDSDFLTLQKLIAEDVLGPIVQFESHFDRYRPIVRDRWRESDVPGGGLWWDLGPHLVDQAILLFGVPDSIHADLAAQRAGAKTTDYFHVLMQYPNLKVILHGSCLISGSPVRFAVHGQKGSYIKYELDAQEDLLRAGKTPGCEGWGIDPNPGKVFSGATPIPIKTVKGEYREFYMQVRDAIHGPCPPPVTMAQALEVVRILSGETRA